MNQTRRTFVKGMLAFAALAVSPSLPAKLVESEHQRLFRLMKTGLIENETFHLNGIVILKDVGDLMVRNCTFEIDHDDTVLEIQSGCDRLTFIDNCFNFAKVHYTDKLEAGAVFHITSPVWISGKE